MVVLMNDGRSVKRPGLKSYLASNLRGCGFSQFYTHKYQSLLAVFIAVFLTWQGRGQYIQLTVVLKAWEEANKSGSGRVSVASEDDDSAAAAVDDDDDSVFFWNMDAFCGSQVLEFLTHYFILAPYCHRHFMYVVTEIYFSWNVKFIMKEWTFFMFCLGLFVKGGFFLIKWLKLGMEHSQRMNSWYKMSNVSVFRKIKEKLEISDDFGRK